MSDQWTENHLAEAILKALPLGIRLMVHPQRPELAWAVCKNCGHGTGEGREIVIEKYAAFPFACPACGGPSSRNVPSERESASLRRQVGSNG